jgi:ketosteroid isomerase-like protein
MAKVLEYYADDAVILDSGRDPIRGKAAIRAYLEEALAIPGFAIRWEPVSGQVDGNLGYLVERTQITMTGPTGQPVRQAYNGLSVWRKLPDGTWRNIVGTSVPGPKAGPQPAG